MPTNQNASGPHKATTAAVPTTTGTMEDARNKGNLRLLQRACMPPGRSVQEIMGTAMFVVLYEFENDQWKKCGTEGPLFVASSIDTSSQPPYSVHYHLIVTNRLSVQNFVRTLTPAWSIERQPPYLIVRPEIDEAVSSGSPPASPPTYGVWFSDTVELEAVYHVLQATLHKIVSAPPLPPPQMQIQTFSAPVSSTGSSIESVNAAAAALTLKTVLGIVDPSTATNSNTATAAAASTSSSPATSRSSHTQPPMTLASDQSPLTTAPVPGVPTAPLVLDKAALQLSLLSLLQDDRFLDLLHAQYIRVLRNSHSARSRSSTNTDDVQSSQPPSTPQP